MDFTLFISQDVTVKNDGSAKGNVKYLRSSSCRNVRVLRIKLKSNH